MRCLSFRWLLACMLLAFVSAAQAESFVVSDIEVRGLQRVSAGTVFSALPISIGDTIESADVAEGIRTLFQTGLFTDVEMAREDNVLIVRVKERPSISGITIDGNESIETKQLMDALKQAGLAEGQVFKRFTLERIELEILRSYVAQGRYGAQVKAEVEQQPRNRVAIALNIVEGEVASIHHINIVGNKAFDDETLIDLMELKRTSLWNSIMSADKYAREKLTGDLERIRSFYLDRGYVRFSVESSQVSISPDKKRVFISIAVNEGPQYTVREVAIRGELIVPKEELEKFLVIKEGEVFSRQKMTLTAEAISKRLGREGYTFANVNGVPETHDDNTATVTFYVEPGKRTYVRRIEFRGNATTHDEVLRQQMVQMEGAVASTDLIEASKSRLDRLGFFKSVNVETPAVPGTNDQIDVQYSVEEQPTGSLSASLGFSQSSGILLGGSISEQNFLGSGKSLRMGINFSESIKSANFSFRDPFFTVDGVSRGFSLSARQTDFDEEDLSSFILDSYRGSMSFGYPISSLSRLNFGYGVTFTDLQEDDRPAQEISAFIEEFGRDFLNFEVNASWTHNSLNRGVFPTNGFRQSASLEVTVPGSDLTFYKASHRTDYYLPFDRQQRWVFHTRTDIQFADGFGESKTLPFFENFFAGGFGSVRGFEANTLGPEATPALDDPFEPDPFGGNVSIVGGIEMIVPTPFAADSRSMRTVIFLDGGNVFDTDRNAEPAFEELRFSAGIGFQWITPIGPLAFSLANPLNDEPEDDVQQFQFSLGQQF